MKYLNSYEIAELWNISERSVRNYCNAGRVPGAILVGKTWKIPYNAEKPIRETRHVIKKSNLLEILKKEKDSKIKDGIYHKLQIEMTYNSNHIEGSKLTIDQTKSIFETHTIGNNDDYINIDDIIETTNHFRCVDLAIESANNKLTESLIKQFHYILKYGTSDSNKSWFKVGDYKLLANEAGDNETVPPNKVKEEINNLLSNYNKKESVDIYDIIKFHNDFEHIHPFQDGNGRVGRLIILKECLKHNIVPILILDAYKQFYYRGLNEYDKDSKYLIDTCLFGQDILKKYLDKFNINYGD